MTQYLSLSRKRYFLMVSLGTIVLGLVVAIALLNKQLVSNEAAKVLLPAADAHAIVITQSDGETIEMEKNGENWFLTQPGKYTADAQRVKPLLSLLRLPSHGLYAAKDVDLNLLGLESPKAVVKINDLEYLLGSSTADNKRYVLIGDSVFLSADIVFPLINGGVAAFRQAEQKTRTTSAPED